MRHKVRQLPPEMLSLHEVSPSVGSCPALPTHPPSHPPSRERRTQSAQFLGSKQFPFLGLSLYNTLCSRWIRGGRRGEAYPFLPSGWRISIWETPEGEARKGSHGVAQGTCPSPPRATSPQLHLQTLGCSGRKRGKGGGWLADSQLFPCCVGNHPQSMEAVPRGSSKGGRSSG